MYSQAESQAIDMAERIINNLTDEKLIALHNELVDLGVDNYKLYRMSEFSKVCSILHLSNQEREEAVYYGYFSKFDKYFWLDRYGNFNSTSDLKESSPIFPRNLAVNIVLRNLGEKNITVRKIACNA